MDYIENQKRQAAEEMTRIWHEINSRLYTLGIPFDSPVNESLNSEYAMNKKLIDSLYALQKQVPVFDEKRYFTAIRRCFTIVAVILMILVIGFCKTDFQHFDYMFTFWTALIVVACFGIGILTTRLLTWIIFGVIPSSLSWLSGN